MMDDEVRHFMTGGVEGYRELRLQIKPTVVCSYADTHHFTFSCIQCSPYGTRLL